VTEYVILEQNSDNHSVWQEKSPEYVVKASSAKRALQSAALGAGTYVALPARSWKPLTVKTEQVTKVTIG
jgi:hypothetical protein